VEVTTTNNATGWFGGLPVGKCTRCQQDIKMYSENQPRDGMHLRLFDGYGMFTDSWEKPLEDIILCHNCVLWFLEGFPEEYKQQFIGGHGPGGDCSPACEYAFNLREDMQ